jgi:hypothetical protein
MSILDGFPHTFVAKSRARTADTLGGMKDGWTTASSGSCWHQQSGDSEITEHAKRGINISGKVYFTADPEFDETNVLVISDKDGNEVGTFDIVSHPQIDASAGLGVVWRCNVNRKTTED